MEFYICFGVQYCIQFSSIQFSLSVVSDYLWPHGLQHARLPCPSPSPGICSNSCPLRQWAIQQTTSVVSFSCCLQSFSASGSFDIKWPNHWSFSFSISPSNEYPGLTSFRMEWLDLLAGARGTPRKLHRVKPLGRGRGRAGARGGGNPRFPGPAFVFAQTAYWEIQRSRSTSANAVPSAISTLQRNTASEKWSLSVVSDSLL